MDRARRSFFGALAAALGVAGGMLAARGAAQVPVPKPPEPEPETLPGPNTHSLLQANQKEIKREAQRLFELANELKKEVEKTDSSAVLSLTLVRKAEEIEKLAKHIKTLARG